MSERVLLFSVGGAVLAVPAVAGREAFVPQTLSPLPGTGGALLGLTRVRGGVAPLVDLAALSGLPAPQAELALLVEEAGESLAFGVDGVLGFAELDTLPAPGGELLSAPQALAGSSVRVLHLSALTRDLRARLA